MFRLLNREQRKSLSEFFNTIAAGWFIAIFTSPVFNSQVSPLIIITYAVNMIGAIFISLILLRNDYE